MKMIDELKKQYDSKSIKEIETEMKKFQTSFVEAEEQKIRCLFYLKKTARYREFPGYKNTGFDVFLSDKFTMRINTYHGLEKAYFHFPKEAKKYSAGLIAKISKKCGAAKIKPVLEAIQKADNKLKTNITREAIEVIVNKHKKVVPIKQLKEVVGIEEMRGRYETERSRRIALEKENKELSEQISKLQETVANYENLREAVAAFGSEGKIQEQEVGMLS